MLTYCFPSRERSWIFHYPKLQQTYSQQALPQYRIERYSRPTILKPKQSKIVQDFHTSDVCFQTCLNHRFLAIRAEIRLLHMACTYRTTYAVDHCKKLLCFLYFRSLILRKTAKYMVNLRRNLAGSFTC